MASKLSFIKHNLMLEHADLFNKSSRRDASVEEEEFGVEKQEENVNEDCGNQTREGFYSIPSEQRGVIKWLDSKELTLQGIIGVSYVITITSLTFVQRSAKTIYTAANESFCEERILRRVQEEHNHADQIDVEVYELTKKAIDIAKSNMLLRSNGECTDDASQADDYVVIMEKISSWMINNIAGFRGWAPQVILSDFEPAIYASVDAVFGGLIPRVKHRGCNFHFERLFKSKQLKKSE
uniref:MULE transposase domain-containing protein n=1 Tax=Ditylenchus dipsaci TaxID=166011 RepID=A0A915E136_9BILA